MSVSSSSETSNLTIVDWLRSSAENHPEHTAIQFGRTAISYQALDEASTHLANSLHATGFRQGNLALLLTPDTPHELITQFGVWKAGGAIIHAAPDTTARALFQLLKDCQANTVFVRSDRYYLFKRAQAQTNARRVIVCALLDYLEGWDKARFRLTKERAGGHQVKHKYTDLRWRDMLKLGAKAPAPNVKISAETTALLTNSNLAAPVTHGLLLEDKLYSNLKQIVMADSTKVLQSPF